MKEKMLSIKISGTYYVLLYIYIPVNHIINNSYCGNIKNTSTYAVYNV